MEGVEEVGELERGDAVSLALDFLTAFVLATVEREVAAVFAEGAWDVEGLTSSVT